MYKGQLRLSFFSFMHFPFLFSLFRLYARLFNNNLVLQDFLLPNDNLFKIFVAYLIKINEICTQIVLTLIGGGRVCTRPVYENLSQT